jgi:hypothetical protein
MKALVRVCVIGLAVLFAAQLFRAPVLPVDWMGAFGWFGYLEELGLPIICAGVAVWASIEYFRSDRRLQKMVYASLVAAVALSLSLELFVWAAPKFRSAVLPAITVVGYLIGLLIACALIGDVRRRSREQARDVNG